ncbi:hypothetical protein ACA910_019337 [Epithemia clementina (nom. ined.)]
MASLVWSRVRSVPVQYPFAFGVVFSGFKTSVSDLMAQKVVEQRETIDWKRNMAFAAFGFIYLGGVQYAIYVPLFGRIFPTAKGFAAKSLRDKIKDVRGMFECVAQVFVDQCIHHPLMYFPAFYCTRELVMHSDNPNLTQVLQEYRRNMKEDLLALWKIWVPATFVNFAFMPMWGRIPTVAMTSLVWSVILSTMRGGDVKSGAEVAGGAVTGATLHMVEEGFGTLFTQRPVELEPDKAHLIITAGGLDKPGWVAELSRAIANAGGSITHSRMVRLGADFIITLHAAVPPQEENEFMQKLRSNQGLKPLNLQFGPLTRRDPSAVPQPDIGVRVRAVGADRPGMLASISETLLAKGLSIETVTTDLHLNTSSRTQPRRDFVIEADCVATKSLTSEELQSLVEDLSQIKTALTLDTVDVRVQRLPQQIQEERRRRTARY